MIRKKKSNEMLSDSLIDLLERFPFEKVTVNQIAENCGIAKRTFYNHFRDKYDLAVWTFIHQLETYYASDDSVTFRSMMYHSIEIVYKDQHMLRNIINYTGQNNFRQSILAPMVEIYCRLIADKYGDPVTPELKTVLFFYLGGQIAFAESALISGDIPSVDETYMVFSSCVPEHLRHYLV